jgi:hypothetical protein
MARERSDLDQRRDELTRSLPGLSEKRAHAHRCNSDALALRSHGGEVRTAGGDSAAGRGRGRS